MIQRPLSLVVAALLLAPAGAAGQVHWESPFHMGPDLTDGLGIHLVDPTPGSGIGAMVTWRRGSMPGGVGLRIGLAEGYRDELSGFGGVDISGLLMARTEEFPLDLMWATGAGGAVGDYALISFPLGLYVGRSIVGEGVRFVPYAGPRLTLDGHLGRERTRTGPGGGEVVVDDDELELAFSVDLGGDIVFSDDLAVRFGASVGDHDALSIGVVFPGVR